LNVGKIVIFRHLGKNAGKLGRGARKTYFLFIVFLVVGAFASQKMGKFTPFNHLKG